MMGSSGSDVADLGDGGVLGRDPTLTAALAALVVVAAASETPGVLLQVQDLLLGRGRGAAHRVGNDSGGRGKGYVLDGRGLVRRVLTGPPPLPALSDSLTGDTASAPATVGHRNVVAVVGVGVLGVHMGMRILLGVPETCLEGDYP